MIRTGTATHRLLFPFTLTNADALQLTYSQGETIKLELGLEDVTVDDNVVTVDLSQAQTKTFNAGVVEIQAKVKIGDNVIPTKISKIPVGRILNDKLIPATEGTTSEVSEG